VKESRREGLGESQERESMTDGGGVFNKREIEVEEGEGLIIIGKKAEERAGGISWDRKLNRGKGVYSSIKR
jgi:hypothetical protein